MLNIRYDDDDGEEISATIARQPNHRKCSSVKPCDTLTILGGYGTALRFISTFAGLCHGPRPNFDLRLQLLN